MPYGRDHKMARLFARFFSTDSHKAIKAQGFGYLNAINYMAPSTLAGVGNVCPNASPACIALCLGWHSGQASMVPAAQADTALNNVRLSRVNKTRLFFHDRPAFMREAIAGIDRARLEAQRKGLKLCVRLNGSSDLPFESLKAEGGRTILQLFPDVQFVDYTKSPKRALRAATDPTWPANYHLTFSRSELNLEACVAILEAGGQVAVVSSRERPAMWHGFPTVDGDQHDLRHLDGRGVVVWLTPKGGRAARDKSGFVLR